jgi:hypothetical protein
MQYIKPQLLQIFIGLTMVVCIMNTLKAAEVI